MNKSETAGSQKTHIQTTSFQILAEISWVLGKVNQQEAEEFLREIQYANTIVACGAGRVGMAVRGFAMRLAHLGKHVHMLGDATVPALGKGDLLIVASGSGETQTIYDLVEIAHKNGARIALITGNPDSRMGKLADAIILLPAPSKTKQVEGFTSIQPMTTLNEQCLGILFDCLVLMLMEQMHETHDTMWARHSNLE
ncbi:MAG: SIS domain-containing protein [Candidatus Andersenbacteria bacterium]|nr:SIS domain-containing protein [Candidatus Andersenbacteria bacterium]